MTVLIWVAAVVLYCLTGCFVGAKAAVMFKRRSPDRYDDDSAFNGVFVAVFWPLAGWLLLGNRLMDRELAKDARREAALKAREAEVKERERLLELARHELEREGLR